MMELKRDKFMFVSTMILAANQLLFFVGGAHIGVDYGRLGDNLPAPSDVISLYKRCRIESLRLFDPSPEVLQALRGSNLRVSLGVRNEDLPSLAASQAAANAWVNTNVAPYGSNVTFGWITLGNEVIPGPFAASVAPAINNIQNAINSIGLSGTKVTTVTATILASSYPPSEGVFSGETIGVMRNITTLLKRTGAPIMVNVYPYFAYASDPSHISFEYATFRSSTPVVDGRYKYYSLFDAMVDAYYAALEKIDAGNVPIVVSETGWPTAGNGPYTSVANAQAYNKNLLGRVGRQGTPRRPDRAVEAFIFAMFNENRKPNGVEQNWGLFYPSMKAVYPLFQGC